MKSKVKGDPVTLQTPDGVNFPGGREDDGIRTTYRAKYEDMARAQIEHYEKHGYPTGTQTGPDPLDTDMEEAARYLADVEAADHDTLGKGDNTHAFRLHYELDRLREALDGGDVRHAARAGVAFGKALEEMRVRMGGASAVAKHRARVAALEIKKDLNPNERNARDEGIRREYSAYKEAHPYCDGFKAIGEKHDLCPRQVRRIVTGK